jgi:hypothetical protein
LCLFILLFSLFILKNESVIGFSVWKVYPVWLPKNCPHETHAWHFEVEGTPSTALEFMLWPTLCQDRQASDRIFIISCAWGCPQQRGIFQTLSHKLTLWGTLSPWKNKSNIQPPLVRIWKLVVRLTIRHSEKVSGSNNLIFIITCSETNYAPLILECEWSKKENKYMQRLRK